MPTNKLWIEHTERAAWQSVQALREKLAEAEQRAERMAPPVEGWQKLLDALDLARQSHALSGETYAELVRSALDRLARADAERRSLEARLRGEPAPPIAEVRPLPPRRLRRDEARDWADDEPDSEQPNRSERRFFKEIRRRAGELAEGRSRPELDPAEIVDIAADLAALALRLRPLPDLDDD
ncbi:MAG TPA: hypothetical protein VF103_12250 [Polyangiaceae bacterium]